eukprot:gene10867-7533_t
MISSELSVARCAALSASWHPRNNPNTTGPQRRATLGFFPPERGQSERQARQKREKDMFGYRFERHFPVPQRIRRVNGSLVEAVNDFHFAMMNDSDRNEFYYKMLEQHITPETGVLEIGAGSGLLSIMAGKLGAKWVVAVEGSAEMSELAKANVLENNLQNKVTVLNMLSTELMLEDLPERPHILVSEIFGTLLLGESALDYIVDVRERLLRPDTAILPQLGVQYAVPIECPTLETICTASSWNGIHLSHVVSLQDTVSTVFTKQYGFRLSSVPFKFLAEPIKLLDIDFSKDSRESYPMERDIHITPTSTGVAHAWLYYWKASHPGCTREISTAPNDTLNNFPRDMQWGQALQLIDEGMNPKMAKLLTLHEGEPAHFRCYFSVDRRGPEEHLRFLFRKKGLRLSRDSGQRSALVSEASHSTSPNVPPSYFLRDRMAAYYSHSFTFALAGALHIFPTQLKGNAARRAALRYTSSSQLLEMKPCMSSSNGELSWTTTLHSWSRLGQHPSQPYEREIEDVFGCECSGVTLEEKVKVQIIDRGDFRYPMNVRFTTVCCQFHRRDVGGSAPVPRHLDVEALARTCWNTELKRSRSLEPLYCTIRLPPMTYGDGCVLRNGVASVRAGGTVHVLGSAPAEVLLALGNQVRGLIARAIAGDAAADRQAREDETKEERQFWEEVLGGSAVPSAAAARPAKALVEPDEIFSSPEIVFVRMGLCPVPAVLDRLREAALQGADTPAADRPDGPPLHIAERRRKRARDPEEGVIELNVKGDEALLWLAAFMGAAESTWTEEDLLSHTPSRRASHAFVRDCMRRLRTRVVDGHAQRLPKRTGVHLQLHWRSAPLTEDALGHTDATTFSVDYFGALASANVGPTESPDGERSGGVLHHGPDPVLHKVDCILFATGLGQVVSSDSGGPPSSCAGLGAAVCPSARGLVRAIKELCGGIDVETSGVGVFSQSPMPVCTCEMMASGLVGVPQIEDAIHRRFFFLTVPCMNSANVALYLQLLVFFLFGLALGLASAMWGLNRFWAKAKNTVVAATSEEMKMVLVVRRDLKMGAGKVAAQCAHAAVASVEVLSELGSSDAPLTPTQIAWHQWFTSWRHMGYAKVVLQCPDEAEMMALPYYIIRDAGRTQIAAGSKTVIAVGPGPKSLVDTATGHLKLF